MNKDLAWKKFQKTGKVSDYLNYRRECINEESIEDANNY